MVLLSSLSTYAQKMVGDGFGGRAGYNPVNLVTGRDNSGIICADKTLYIWGMLQYDLNNGVLTTTSTPTQANVSNVRQVAMGNSHSTYIKDDGTGYLYGEPTPYNNSLISNAYHTDGAGSSGFVFVKTDGTVWFGGNNPTITGGTSPCPCTNNQPSTYCVTQVPGLTNIKRVAISSAFDNIVALATDGTVKTIYGNVIYPASLKSTTAITIPGLSNIVDVKASGGNYYALTSSGQVYAWGAASGMGNGYAQSSQTYYMPQLVTFPAGAAPIKAIVPSRQGAYCLALDENDVCYVWGYSFKDGGSTYYSTPQVIATNVRDMVAAGEYDYYYKNDGTLWGLGRKDNYMFNLSTPNTPSNFTTLTQLTIPSTMCTIQSFTGMPPCTVNNITPVINKN